MLMQSRNISPFTFLLICLPYATFQYARLSLLGPRFLMLKTPTMNLQETDSSSSPKPAPATVQLTGNELHKAVREEVIRLAVSALDERVKYDSCLFILSNFDFFNKA